MKKLFAWATLGLICGCLLVLTGCDNDADVASTNISTAAANFQIPRRIVFYNGISGDYILEVEGLCDINADNPKKLMVTCKVGPGLYKKNYLGVSDNVTWFAEQLDAAAASTQRYTVVWKPSTIIPSINLR